MSVPVLERIKPQLSKLVGRKAPTGCTKSNSMDTECTPGSTPGECIS
jgi:hypothetical protein